MGGAHILPQLFPTQAEHLMVQEKGVFNPDSNDVLLSADGRSLYLIPTIFMTQNRYDRLSNFVPWSQRRFLPCGVLLCWMPPRITLQLHKVRFTGQQWRLNITKMSTTFFKYMNVSKCEVTYPCLILNPKVLLQPRNSTFPTARHPWSSRRTHAHGWSCSCNCCLVT